MKKEYYELTSPQKNIWMLEQSSDNKPINILLTSMHITSDVDINVLKKTIYKYIENNLAMQTRLVILKDKVKQYYETFNIENSNVHFIEDENIDVENYINELKKININIYNSFLYEIYLIKNKNGVYIIAKFHHLIMDAWSMANLSDSICNIYKNILENNEYFLNDELQYTTYIKNEVEYLNSEKYLIDENFWLEEFGDVEKVNIKKTENINSYKSIRYVNKLSIENTEKIKQFCNDNNISVFNLFFSALALYLNKTSGVDNFCIGTPILNRANYKEKQIAGLFISTIALKIEIDKITTVLELLKYTSNNSKKCFRHIKYPYINVLEKLYEEKKTKESLYDVLISYQNSKVSKEKDCPFTFEVNWHYIEYQKDPLMIHITDIENDGVLKIYYDYIKELFTNEDIEIFNNRIMYIIEQIINNKDKNISQINLINKEEEIKLDNYNFTKYEHLETTIKDMFEEQVKKTPELIAVEFGEEKLTYEELNNIANNIANNIKKHHINIEDVVGICMGRSNMLIASILGVLKSGACYVPIDKEYPDDRIAYMIENSNLKLIITDFDIEKITKKPYINIKDNLKINKVDNLDIKISNNNLAYIMYTSGSTGKPKAVMVENNSVINYIESVNNYMDYTNNKRILSVTTMSFDIFVFELFPTICLGHTLIIANEKEQKMPDKLIDLINTKKVQKLMTTPSRMQMLFDYMGKENKLDTIEEIALGGEAYTEDLDKKIKQKMKTKVFNCYGPTETTVYSTFENMTNCNEITIGKPINNTQIYILDKNNNIQPFNIIGEIAIGGLGVSRGYLKQEELTNEKYINTKKGILYKTGDLGIYRNDGKIKCLGRIDNQVKIRGFRVELDEIEKNILELKNINNTIVTILEEGENKFICAYVVGENIDLENIKKYLLGKLPRYMVPSFYKIIEKIPTNHNGKIDKKSLPKPEKLNLINKYVKPSTDEEKNIIKAFNKYIDEENISIEENIFDMGIDSLIIIKIQVELFALGYLFSTQDFYNYPTISELAKLNKIKKQKIKITNENNREKTFINNDFSEIGNLKNNKKRNILITGVTGYLGIHILKEILDNTKDNIYCIIRDKEITAEERLKNKLKFYFNGKYINKINKRIFVLKGDISFEKFDLLDSQFLYLKENITEIIHVAANVKYYGDFEEFKKNNIEATNNISNFAYENNKILNYISSLGVSGHFLVEHENKDSIFSEDNLYIGQNYEQNNYVKSKYLTEQNLYNDFEQNNLQLRVFRVGNLTGRYKDGIFQENINENAFYNIIKSIIKLKVIPTGMLNNSIDFSPVDLVSKSIIKIIMLENSVNHTYHIANNYITSIEELLNIMSKIGIEIKVLNDEEFSEFAYNVAINSEKSDALEGLINDINSKKQITFNAGVKVDSKKSEKILKKVGVKFNKLNIQYLRKIIKSIKKNNKKR